MRGGQCWKGELCSSWRREADRVIAELEEAGAGAGGGEADWVIRGTMSPGMDWSQ